MAAAPVSGSRVRRALPRSLAKRPCLWCRRPAEAAYMTMRITGMAMTATRKALNPVAVWEAWDIGWRWG